MVQKYRWTFCKIFILNFKYVAVQAVIYFNQRGLNVRYVTEMETN